MRIIAVVFTAGLLGIQPALAEIEWHPAEAGDLVSRTLTDPERIAAPEGVNTSRDAVAFSWPMADEDGAPPALTSGLAGHVQESRQYWIDVSSVELGQGIQLPLTAEGAVVRISPREPSMGIDLSRENLVLHIDGEELDTSRDIEHFADSRSLASARMPAPEETIIFRLKPEAGFGELSVQLGILPRVVVPLVVHIHEPHSDVAASVALDRTHFLAGEDVELDLELVAGTRSIVPGRVQAELMNPDATRAISMEWSARNNSLGVRLPEDVTDAPGVLWEAQIYLQGETDGRPYMRDVQIAFGVGLPTARLSGEVVQVRDDALSLGVEVSQAGRYQLSGVIYGTDARGEMQPVSMGQFANWLEPGDGVLDLPLDRAALAESGFTGPWEVRDLRLNDQGRLSLLHYQARAITLTE